MWKFLVDFLQLYVCNILVFSFGWFSVAADRVAQIKVELDKHCDDIVFFKTSIDLQNPFY